MLPIEASPQPGILAGVRVLVVDNDAACRRAHKQLFTLAGATVETARRAQDAFVAFCRTRPHLVVSDLVMLGEDGCWMLR
jgi:DNA-binding NtrC family response regulator